MKRPSALTLMTGAAVSWALATVMTKVTLEELSALDLLTVEVIVGAAAVWTAVWLRGIRTPAGRFWRDGRLGLVEPALAFALFDFGIDNTGRRRGCRTHRVRQHLFGGPRVADPA